MRVRTRCTSVALRLAALVATPLALSAQALDRSKPPAASTPAPFTFPKTQTHTLPNGLRVIVVEDHALPLVAVRAVVGADAINDPAGKEGLYALTAGMLREGTATNSAEQLAGAAAALGDTVAAFRFTTITPNFERWLELMADMLVRPTFPEPALDRLKVTLAAAQQRALQAPAAIPNRVFLTQLFGPEHSVVRTAVAAGATIAGITREDLQEFHKAYFRPNNTTLVVVGDLRTADVVRAVTRTFGDWAKGVLPAPSDDAARAPQPTTVYLLDRPAAQQSYMFVGALGPGRSSQEFAALEVMARVVGTGTGSRLSRNLRDRHAYMYSGTPLGVIWRREPTPSVIGGSAAVATAKTDSALIEWLRELRDIREREPSEEEVAVVRRALMETLPAQIETDDLIANRLMTMVQGDIPLDFYGSYGTRIAAVTPASVRAAAAKYLDSSRLVIVIAGERRVVEPLLRAANVGPVVIVNESGKPE